MMTISSPTFLVIDLFCGAGGTTTGFEMTGGIAKVIACVNHDPVAIKSHWKNHKDVVHFEEDIRTLKLQPLIDLVNIYRNFYPDAYVILWASLECTNFSKAKGGQPRDADSRTLADHLDRYVVALQPDYVKIENVVEFMSWGPLDDNGKPVSRKNGQDFMRWKKMICEHGYVDEWRELNSANFGAYTSRNRLFGVFARPGLPIVWPKPTHAKNPVKNSMYGEELEKWKAVKDVLNFGDKGESIFNRRKPLSDKTLQRIYAGLVKYVAGGQTSFISKYFSGLASHQVKSINKPAGVITTIDHHSLVQPEFLLKYNSMNQEGKHTPPSVEDPAPVVAAQSRLGLVQTEFIAAYYGNGDNTTSIERPCPTVVTKDRFAVVQAEPFIMPTNYDNQPKSIDDPLQTITANRKWHYLVNPSWGGNPGSVESPCCVVVARQDKAPLYLIEVNEGEVSVPVYEDDTEAMIQVKQFMAAFGIVDIRMRMLRVDELLRIQGFPEGYQLDGTQTDQKKFIGNSVVPIMPKVWAEAMHDQIQILFRKIA
jgi:DNA (cytosine-5)-methyltransferase 1